MSRECERGRRQRFELDDDGGGRSLRDGRAIGYANGQTVKHDVRMEGKNTPVKLE